MAHETATPAVEVAPLADNNTAHDFTQEVPFVFWLCLFYTYVRFVERSLLKEFHHTESVFRNAWMMTLSDVKRASAGWLNWQQTASKIHIIFFQNCIAQGLQIIEKSLDGNDPHPDWVSVSYVVLGKVTLARRSLGDWLTAIRVQNENSGELPDLQRLLQEIEFSELPSPVFPSQEAVQRKLDQAVYQFDSAIDNKDDFNRCTCSRRVCHTLLYMLTLYPRIWSPALHQELVWLHRRAVERMSGGKLRQSVDDRLQYLLKMSPVPHSNLENFRHEILRPICGNN